MNQKTKNLIAAVSRLCPLGDTGFVDIQCWGSLRRLGFHDDAERLTTLANDIRSALADFLSESEPDSRCTGCGGLAMHFCPQCGNPACGRKTGLCGHVDQICAACVSQQLIALSSPPPGDP